MKLTEIDLTKAAAFGVAGNFTGHLEQAGEDRDFTQIKAEEGAPKALFPTFIPCSAKGVVPQFLTVYPFNSQTIDFPEGEQKLQIEPECAVVCRVNWQEQRIASLEPLYFCASNDCSIRKEGARKISLKKNWGARSKGISDNFIPIDSFDEKGILGNYRISSFMVRNGQVYGYGEDSSVRSYSYIWQKLLDWCVDRLNNQQDVGPGENIHEYLLDAQMPQYVLISVGATRYLDFGEHNFLQDGDQAVVAVYPEDKYSGEEIEQMVRQQDFTREDISFLCQTVCL